MKILIIQTAFLGDLVLTTGFIRRVYEKHNSPKISIIVNKGTEDILKGNPYISEIIPFDKKKMKKGITGFLNFCQEIHKRKFSICYSPHFSHRSSLISFFSGAQTRIGYRESGFSIFHTHKFSRPRVGMHEINKLFKLLGEEDKPYKPELYFPEEDLKHLEKKVLSQLHGKKYILIAPSSVWETKRMPAFKFREITKYLLDNSQYIPVLIGSPSDISISSEVKEGMEDRVIDFTGKTNLQEFSFIISKASGIITNDSSPVHIASAFDIPTVTVFGATIQDFGYTNLSTKTFVFEIQGLDCRPCGIHGGKVCPEKHFKCMLEQDPISISRKILELAN
jgi:heptosyltransferase-2